MNLELAKSSGAYFMPDSVSAYLGRFPREVAQIKAQPKFFVVEEQSTETHRCTTGTESDLPSGCQFGTSGGTGHLTRVTLVKKGKTTPDAIDEANGLLAGGRARISYAGLKDNQAITAQSIVIEGVDFDQVVRCCMPSQEQLDKFGLFLKDPERTNRHLGKGRLIGNNFILKVLVPGMTAAQLEQYLAARVNHLTRGGVVLIPNAFGNQRLGKRQNLFGVSVDFIHDGPEVGIKRFLTEKSPNESPWANQVRERLLDEWEGAERRAAQQGTTVAKQILHLQGMKKILEEKGRDNKPVFKRLNMIIEQRIVTELLLSLDYTTTMRRLEEDFSLWGGAYHGFWFNQILGGVLTGDIELDTHGDPEAKIPLFMDEPRALRFYNRFMPAAIPERMDPTVRRMFLTTRSKHDRGPRRPLFVPVMDLEYTCEDGAVNMRFRLPKGAYATTFLGILFNIDHANDKRVAAQRGQD